MAMFCNRLFLIIYPIVLLMGCSKGGFQDRRDHFQSVYGLSPLPLNLVSSSFIGRIVDEEDQAIALANVYLKGSALYTTSNQKGGFLLTGLQDLRNTVYIIGSNGLGNTLEIDLNDSHLVENQHIKLAKKSRISGLITSGSAQISEARISMEGSPFSTLSDGEGRFMLEVPAGKYRLKVQHLLYNPFEIGSITVGSDLVRDISLDPLGFPMVDLLLEKAEGSIVRGLSTKVLIHKSPNVRFMRVINSSFSVQESNVLPNQWVPVQNSLTLIHKKPGLNWLNLQFMDQFGKMTDPIAVTYYNTLYDWSWRLIFGPVKEPLLIRKNEKVAFIGENVSPMTSMDSSTNIPHENSEISTIPPPSSSYLPQIIDVPVEIESGAELRGGAQFNRNLNVLGNAQNPVQWDLKNEASEDQSIWIRGNQSTLRYANFRNGKIVFAESFGRESKDNSWIVDHSSFEQIQVGLDIPSLAKSLFLDFEFCSFNHSRVKFFSWNIGLEAPSSPSQIAHGFNIVQSGNYGATLANKISISMVSNNFKNSELEINWTSADGAEKNLDLLLDKNNFFEQVLPKFYLILPVGILAKNPQIKLTMGRNFFEYPDAIIQDFGTWSSYLGTLLNQAEKVVSPDFFETKILY